MNAHRPGGVPCVVHFAFALALGAIFLTLSPALAIAQSTDTAFFILTNPTNVRNASAQVDVAMDTAATGGAALPINFTLFDEVDGTFLSSPLTVLTNERGYASSTAATPNLFAISGGRTALVRIQYPTTSPSLAAAVLRKDVKGSSTTVAVAPVRNRVGALLTASFQFDVAVGEIEDGLALYIANVSTVTALVDVFEGTRGAQGSGKYFNPNLQPNAIWRVELQPDDAQSNIVVRSTEPVIVQLVRLDGSKVSEVMLLPH